MRLTYKEPKVYGGYNAINTDEYACVIKLGRLEDIEEELGIDLITYFKIKKAQTVFVKEIGNDMSEMIVRNSKDCIDVCYKGFINIPECDTTLYIKDYGKTWALTKEELE